MNVYSAVTPRFEGSLVDAAALAHLESVLESGLVSPLSSGPVCRDVWRCVPDGLGAVQISWRCLK